MKLHALRCVALLAALGLSACSPDLFHWDGGGDCTGDCSDGPWGPFARTFTTTESGVTVVPGAGGFTATRVVTIGNPMEGATHIDVAVFNDVGAITNSATSAADYQIQITFKAEAPTEAQAREALATLSVRHEDQIGESQSGELWVGVRDEVEFADYEASGVERTADVAVALPGSLTHSLAEFTGTGDIFASGLHGTGVELDTSDGDVNVSGTWDEALARTSNGSITLNGDIASISGATSNGDVIVMLPGTRPAQASVSAETGDIDVTVGRTSATDFDLEGASSVGNVTIQVEGTAPEGLQTGNQAHYRSPGYGGSARPVHVDASTTVGNVVVHE